MSIPETIAVVLGFLLRLGVPVALTAILVILLKRLDERWQSRASDQQAKLATNPGCWKLRNCPEERKARCSAYAHPDVPCWQVFRAADGRLLERCLSCEVFRQAPAPMISGD